VNTTYGYTAIAKKSIPSATKSGSIDIAITAGCISVDYGLGAARVDRDRATSTRSSEKVVFTVTCAP
jgi:hypothetical protein